MTAIIHDPHSVRNVVFFIGLCVCTSGDGNELKTRLCVLQTVSTRPFILLWLLLLLMYDDVTADLSAVDCAIAFSPVFGTTARFRRRECNRIYDRGSNRHCCEDHKNLVIGV